MKCDETALEPRCMRATSRGSGFRYWLIGLFCLASCGGCRHERIVGAWQEGAGDSATESGGDGTMDGSSGISTADVTGTGDTITSVTHGTVDTDPGAGSSTGFDPRECGPPGDSVCDYDDDPFHAIGLGCSNNPTDATPLLASRFESPDASAFRVVRQYGDDDGQGGSRWRPRGEGSALLMISTASLPIPDGSDVLRLQDPALSALDKDNGNPNDADLPPSLQPVPGSNGGAGGRPFIQCDGIGDCSDTLSEQWVSGGRAHDLLWFSFQVRVPPQAHGYALDIAWFSREFPERTSAVANDLLVVWSESETYTGNVAYHEGRPATATGLRQAVVDHGFQGEAPELGGTGLRGALDGRCDLGWASFDACPYGGASGWLTLRGSATPGEVLTITVALFDQGDATADTIVLFDRWRWLCEACTPGTSCGLFPA